MKGKIKSVPVKEVTEGMKVLWTNPGTKVTHILTVRPNHIQYVNEDLAIAYAKQIIDELKTLVVEYERDCNEARCLGGDIHNCKTLQLPLKYSQWQAAINAGEVDSDKVVEFEIKGIDLVGTNTGQPDYDWNKQYQIAKIIPQKKRMYTERELEIAYCIGLLNRMLTMDELSVELKTAQKKIDLFKQSLANGDFEPEKA